MEKRSSAFRIFWPLGLAASVLVPAGPSARAATLDDRSGTFVEPGDWLLAEEVSAFTMREDARHASAAYGRVSAQPDYVTFDTSARFALGPSAEATLRHAQAVPTDYRREIYDPAGALTVTQDYELNILRDEELSLRFRRGTIEPYVSFSQKAQKASWYAATLPAQRSYFSYIRTDYETGRAGARWLVGDGGEGSLSNLSLLRGALLDAGQWDFDASLDYDAGHLRRNVAYYFGGALIADNYYHTLDDRLAPGIRVSRGLTDALEASAGLSYGLPYGYAFEYRRQSAAGLSITRGDYATRHEMKVPLGLRYRPVPNGEVAFSSDIIYAQQSLDTWQRATTGVVTVFPARKLKYLNTRPTWTLSYLFERGREVVQDAFARLAGPGLAKGQSLWTLVFRWDVTALNKSAGCGAQNRIDPTNAFLYPLDYFVAGSEAAAYFTGNTSTSATNVSPQDYGLTKIEALYGFTDDFSAGLTAGYRTSSRLHHMTVGSSPSFDLQSRYYVFKPVWFFGVPLRWRPAPNVLVALEWDYVPRYRTTISVAGQAKDFEAKTKYHSVWLKAQILF